MYIYVYGKYVYPFVVSHGGFSSFFNILFHFKMLNVLSVTFLLCVCSARVTHTFCYKKDNYLKYNSKSTYYLT